MRKKNKISMKRVAVAAILLVGVATAFGVSIQQHNVEMNQQYVKMNPTPTTDPQPNGPYYVAGGGAVGHMHYW